MRAPERNREHSIGDQLSALNVGFMERLLTKHEEFDELIPMALPMLVQRAINLLDYGTWKRVLTATGLTAEMATRQYMLDVPSSPLRLVEANVG